MTVASEDGSQAVAAVTSRLIAAYETDDCATFLLIHTDLFRAKLKFPEVVTLLRSIIHGRKGAEFVTKGLAQVRQISHRKLEFDMLRCYFY